METTEKERVRKSTPEKRNKEIDEKVIRNIVYYSSQHPDRIEHRLQELEKEWDIERVLELNASLFALTGVLLGTRNKRWLILPGIVTAFLAQHAIQGWCPPLVLFRAMGYRTRHEIDQEKYSLKVLRGDFDNVDEPREAWRKTR